MATTHYNQKYSASFPKKANKREARLSATNHALTEFDADYTIPDDDNTDFWNSTNTTSSTYTLTFPKAAASKGRCITVRQSGSGGDITPAAAAGDSLEASTQGALSDVDTSVTWFCTGTEWKIVRGS